MKILVIGSGGREHAIGWKLAKSKHQPELFFAPGNPGMAKLGQPLDIEVTDIVGLALFAEKEAIDLTIVGPEVPLSLGIVDEFKKRNLLIFGPEQKAAEIEASKVFAKNLMKQANVPTSGYVYATSKKEALEGLAKFNAPYVIKEDGLAAGKGVTIAPNLQEAENAINNAFEKNMPVVIEEFLEGEELSVLAICDGQYAIPMIGAQDFKKVGEGNTGPNTGGMGAYAPVPFVDDVLLDKIQAQVLTPMMAVFKQNNINYTGVLYAGLMIDQSGNPKVIEFNARFGDPETQVVLPLLEEDLVDVCLASAKGDLSHYFESGFQFKNKSAVTVVLASQGYPAAYEKGKTITFADEMPLETMLFHAGTKLMPDQTIVTSGGRVLNSTGFGDSLNIARENAYQLAKLTQFEGQFCRRDIAEQACLKKVLV